uniref:Uncharacterized protein n=1 Tax=Anguilla anguilla TaxID=7936 RepID=A0A0E9PEB5_ANGAN
MRHEDLFSLEFSFYWLKVLYHCT